MSKGNLGWNFKPKNNKRMKKNDESPFKLH